MLLHMSGYYSTTTLQLWVSLIMRRSVLFDVAGSQCHSNSVCICSAPYYVVVVVEIWSVVNTG